MEVDEEDEDSSEEEEEEEEDQVALQRVRENVRSALGEAALDEDEAAGSDMDDAAMFRLDSALVAAFKAASKGGHTKKAVLEKKRQLLQLKSRCVFFKFFSRKDFDHTELGHYCVVRSS